MIDTHVHLDDSKYNDAAKEIIDSFEADNIDFVINASCDKPSLISSVRLASEFERVYATVGMHPHTAKDYDDDFEKLLIDNASNSKVVAVGEIGLDYYYDFSDRNTQRDVFARQIELADQLKLPLVLHIRDAYGDAQDILNAQKKYLNSGVLWHCYSGSAEFARQMATRGHYFAFGGAITFKNAMKAEVVRAVPIAQVLSETDCPYMTPEPFRGRLNYPKYVSFVTNKLAEFYNVTTAEMEAQIVANCRQFFKRIK